MESNNRAQVAGSGESREIASAIDSLLSRRERTVLCAVVVVMPYIGVLLSMIFGRHAVCVDAVGVGVLSTLLLYLGRCLSPGRAFALALVSMIITAPELAVERFLANEPTEVDKTTTIYVRELSVPQCHGPVWTRPPEGGLKPIEMIDRNEKWAAGPTDEGEAGLVRPPRSVRWKFANSTAPTLSTIHLRPTAPPF